MNSYTFHITLYDLVFFTMIITGLVFALLLAFVKSIHRSANRFLALGLVTIILWMIRVLAIDIKLDTYFPHWDRLPMQFLLALGPLIYFYVLKITSPSYKFRGKDFLHFTPLLLESGALVPAPVLHLLLFVSMMTYLYKSHTRIQNFYRHLQPVLMDRSLLEFRWLRRLLAATALLWGCWICCAAIDYCIYHSQLIALVYYPFYIFFAVILIWTAAAAFLQPRAAIVAQAPAPLKSFASAEFRGKAAGMKRAMEAHRYFEDPELTLSSLAEKLGLHPHELSRIINTGLKKNFNDFINEYRIRDVVSKMKNPAYDNMTLLGIAYEAGFNSKSTFNRSFRQMTGKSPAEFKNQLEKEGPTYHLNPHSGTTAVISGEQTPPRRGEVKVNRQYMFKSYLKIAWRSLGQNKTSSFLNITGLSIGLACSILIALYVQDELHYDRFNELADRTYRVDEQVKFGDFNYNGTQTPAIMGPVFSKDLSQVEHYTRLKRNPGVVIQTDKESFSEDRVAYADSSLFDVFSLQMIAGDKKTALSEPRSLVITETTARKYFTNPDILGKTLLVNKIPYKITGIIKDIPRQSHFNFSMFMPVNELESSRNPSWVNYNFQTYFVLKNGTDPNNFNKLLNKTLNEYLAPQLKTVLNVNPDDFAKAGNFIKCSLMPLTEIHLHSNLEDELGINGNIRDIYIFSAIAIFILLIACINFMNLCTAFAANRAKEVGVRKVLGSFRKNIIAQFLVESFVACFLSFVIAMGMVALALPAFNHLANTRMSVFVLANPGILSGIALLLLLVSLVVGSYPAFYLSSFKPIKVLKGALSAGFKGSTLRNTLVVFQFTISVILMVGTLVIYNQLQYIRNKDLGFNKEQVLLLKNTEALGDNAKAFTNELLQMAGVRNVTRSGFLPVTGARTGQAITTTPHFDGKNFTLMQAWPVDERYLPTFQLQLKSGRNFSAEYLTDSNAVVINETAAKVLGGVDPLNKKLYQVDDIPTGTLRAYTIIGVIKDFNFNSLHDQVAPLILKLGQDDRSIAVRMNTREIPGLLARIKASWKSLAASQPFSYTFLDDEYNKQYEADQRVGKIFFLFSLLAIFIACLGLFGLVTFAAQQRTKEIGIRKVLGATIPGIFKMLAGDFIKLILLSVCIASPIAFWVMNHWLRDFAYRIHISWWMFAAVGIVCLLIALVTISFQAVKAAIANPVGALRTE